MQSHALHERLRSLDRVHGPAQLGLRLGGRQIELEQLDAGLVRELERRWGGFVVPARSRAADLTVRFFRGGPGTWLERWQPGERYRLESVGHDDERVVASYHFGLAREGQRATWRAGLSDDPAEPPARIVENLIRFLAAHLALDDGGFALHAAGILREGRAYLLAGPSRAGKSTAARLVPQAESLGDDYGMVVREGQRWLCPALPFDNSECVRDRPTSGVYPLAGVWRLQQAEATRAESVHKLGASARLLACAAFAWAMPERNGELLDHVRSLVEAGLFRDLQFQRDADLWPHLSGGTAPQS
jgi:hypothetical protein